MSDVDTMRWGDTQSLKIAAVPQGESEQFLVSSQMLNAHWQRPCVWRLMITVQGLFAAADAGMTFALTILLRIGVGQANQLVPLAIIPWTVGTTTDQVLFFDVPAENVQMQFKLNALSTIPVGGPDPNDTVTVSAFIAPRAEPGGIVQIRDGLPGNDGIREPDRDGLARWPARGFDDGEVKYRGQGY